jgi:hypothetical protein
VLLFAMNAMPSDSLLSVTLLIAACEIPGWAPIPRVAQREADARPLVAACRHAMRGIEDCYRLNERAPKTAVFEGWKEMDRLHAGKQDRRHRLEGSPGPKQNPSRKSSSTDNRRPSPPLASKDKPAGKAPLH